MKIGRFSCAIGAWLVFGVAVSAAAAGTDGADTPAVVATPDGATIFRVFLSDGTSLISYGEPALVGDRVVFSMPTSAALDNPPLHLVDLPAHRVDWPRTARYAETARATRYYATRAEADYAALTTEVANALSTVSVTTDPAERVAIVERARKALAEWPRQHYGYKQDEIRPMLGMLDEIVAELRAAIGIDRFDLTFVAGGEVALPREPLLNLPTPKEAIEQALLAARASDSAADRVSLLSTALGAIERDAALLPADWRAEARENIRSAIHIELETDRQYRDLTARMLAMADQRARAADVRGLQGMFDEVAARDEALGGRRRDAVAALTAALNDKLDAARRLRLARDRFALRLPEFRDYGNAMTRPLDRLQRLREALEDIKALAGSSPFALAAIQKGAAAAAQAFAAIAPPDEFRSAHALFASAAQLADSAARIRMEAALSGNLQRAWDASSAAAGALMLETRAVEEFRSLFRLPQLPQ
jgi:hypothetical protein